jgi:uncharacterized membrane protein YphA (DoxX/SURF4 family)
LTQAATRQAATPPTAPGPLGPGVSSRGLAPIPTLILLTLRVALGGIFCLAASTKLASPQSFWEAINAFKVTDDHQRSLMATHILPWIELFGGLSLAVGFWTREAATIICLLLVSFIWVIISAINKGLGGIPCSCFGYWHLVCTGGVGWCKVFENSGLLAIGIVIALTGGGPISLDRALRLNR